MATGAELTRPTSLTRHRPSALQRDWTPAAWGSILLGALFIATTCWWLSRDRSIPVYDAAVHLNFAIQAYEALHSGHLLKAFTDALPYPPLVHIVGAVGVFVVGIGVAAPIIAVNIVFVPLLALGCYKVGCLAFGPSAGLLAVLFALGSPLVIEGFHQFMLDAPEAALVAVAVWAILASDGFSRLGISALAGLTVGLGMLSKETFVFFVAGVALATAVRGGRDAWRGFALFALVALVTTLPWYVYEFSTLHELGSEAFGGTKSELIESLPPGLAPPRLSAANLEWYFWSFLNWQLYLPLFVFSAVGWIWAMVGFVRRRPFGRFATELAIGAFVSWAALTETYVHDARYGIPMIVYLAVFGVGWVSRLPHAGRAVAATALALVAVANFLGVGFGVGARVMSAPLSGTYEQPGAVTLYSNLGLWVGGPSRDGDMLGLLQALRRDGVRKVRWNSEREGGIEYSFQGIAVLARIAGLVVPPRRTAPLNANRYYAFLEFGSPGAGLPTPCITLRHGNGVWVRLGGDARSLSAWSYCPLRAG